MTRIDDLGYPIVVGGDTVAELGRFVRERGLRRAVVLCDRRVERRAREIAARADVRTVVPFALGERRKTMQTLTRVLESLSAAGADRATPVIAVGGGVAGDVFGLAAALYMRGVPFVNVATSLLAMVDAAVGGKNGVDLPAGKNLAGTFRDPEAVFCDLTALQTLPPLQFREGLAEVVKHAVIEGGEAFETLEALAPHALRDWPWEQVVAESVRIKAMVVADDRVERGARETLNLGHTVAHALERATDYAISHGSAVSLGLRGAGLLALRSGRFSAAEHLRVLSLLTLLRLPLHWPGVDADGVFSAMAADKKARSGRLRFVLPRALGDVEYGIVLPAAGVRSVLRTLAEPPADREGRAARIRSVH